MAPAATGLESAKGGRRWELALRIMLSGVSPVTALGIETALRDATAGPCPERITHVGRPATVVETARAGDVDLVILDPTTPALSDGIALCRTLKQGAAPPRVLAFCALNSQRDLLFCHLSGIDSFVSAGEPPANLAAAVSATLRGKQVWLLGQPASQRRSETAMLDALTPRERDVLWLLLERCTNHQIARMLAISPNTVKNHVAAILRKVGVSRRSQLVAGAGTAHLGNHLNKHLGNHLSSL